jgi:transposase
LRAARLLAKTIHQSEVARRVGVHRQSVSRWAQPLEAEGWHGLKKAGRAGRRPRLSAEDLKKIQRGLKRGPEALGYETGLWTAWRVAHLIEEECGVRLPYFAGLANSAATGLELPACGRTCSGAVSAMPMLRRLPEISAGSALCLCCSKEEREKDRLLPFCCASRRQGLCLRAAWGL